MFFKYGCPYLYPEKCSARTDLSKPPGKVNLFSFPVPWPQRKKKQSCEEVYCAGATSKHLSTATTTSRTSPRTGLPRVWLNGIADGVPSFGESQASIWVSVLPQPEASGAHQTLLWLYTKDWAYSWSLYSGVSTENLRNNRYLWLICAISYYLFIR